MGSQRELPPLLLRADAGADQGTGHVMRCLALAEAWRGRGGGAILISRCESVALRARIESSGTTLVSLEPGNSVDADLQFILHQLAEHEAAVLALDGYHFDSQQQQALKIPGHPLLVIDDNAHLSAYHADILLNQNLGAAQLNYRCDPETALLLGPSFALLRPEFLNWRRRFRCVRTIGRRILVTLGGSDPGNFTLRVIEAVGRLDTPGIEVRVVVGPANPYLTALEKAVDESAVAIELWRDVSDMGSLMAWADITVSAGGTTCWELACLGLPALVVPLADNQRRIAHELDAAGVVQNLGWHEEVSDERLAVALENLLYASYRRLSMSDKGRWLVDGRGAERVVEVLLERLSLRRVA